MHFDIGAKLQLKGPKTRGLYLHSGLIKHGEADRCQTRSSIGHRELPDLVKHGGSDLVTRVTQVTGTGGWESD